MHLFSDLPEKQGLLFSDDDFKTDVDTHKTSGLVAAAKITLFEVRDPLVLSFFRLLFSVRNTDR